jgi:hypothetical protein
MLHILNKIITEAHKLDFYFITQNNDKYYNGEYGKKITVPSFKNINAIIFHFSEHPFLAISPNRGVEMPEEG